jgi:transcription initiation factor IIF auxiliary subunit
MNRDGLDIQVRDSVYDPAGAEHAILVRKRSSDVALYRVNLYLEGPDLPYVRRVNYRLHTTFRQRDRLVERSVGNPNCKVEIWTWGLFRVEATVEDKQGRKYIFQHELSYDRELEAAAQSDYKFVS